MRLNERTAIIGDQVVLVPYRKEHVETYHEWMKSPELLEATASEPLSFEEELEMQQKWHLDDDKLTFIILARPTPAEGAPREKIASADEIRTYPMIGDVNLFLPHGVEEDVECEIMIAEQAYRGRGIAREALSLMLNYVTSPTPFAGTTARQLIPAGHYPFLVRIGTTNEASLALFAGLGFARVKVVPAFGEVEMRFGWVPRGDGCDGEGAFMSGEEMERLARERWTEKGTVIAYD